MEKKIDAERLRFLADFIYNGMPKDPEELRAKIIQYYGNYECGDPKIVEKPGFWNRVARLLHVGGLEQVEDTVASRISIMEPDQLKSYWTEMINLNDLIKRCIPLAHKTESHGRFSTEDELENSWLAPSSMGSSCLSDNNYSPYDLWRLAKSLEDNSYFKDCTDEETLKYRLKDYLHGRIPSAKVEQLDDLVALLKHKNGLDHRAGHVCTNLARMISIYRKGDETSIKAIDKCLEDLGYKPEADMKEINARLIEDLVKEYATDAKVARGESVHPAEPETPKEEEKKPLKEVAETGFIYHCPRYSFSFERRSGEKGKMPMGYSTLYKILRLQRI